VIRHPGADECGLDHGARRLDPTFLAELASVGKRKADSAAGESAVADIKKWHDRAQSMLEKQAASLQSDIDREAAKRWPVAAAASIQALSIQLASFKRDEIEALYRQAEPAIQMAIEGLNATTYSVMPERRAGNFTAPRWVEIVPKVVREECAVARNATRRSGADGRACVHPERGGLLSCGRTVCRPARGTRAGKTWSVSHGEDGGTDGSRCGSISISVIGVQGGGRPRCQAGSERSMLTPSGCETACSAPQARARQACTKLVLDQHAVVSGPHPAGCHEATSSEEARRN